MAKMISLPVTGKGPGTNIYDLSCYFALSWLPCGGGGIMCSLRHKQLGGVQLEMWEKSERFCSVSFLTLPYSILPSVPFNSSSSSHGT